jgi:hypothetical protein
MKINGFMNLLEKAPILHLPIVDLTEDGGSAAFKSLVSSLSFSPIFLCDNSRPWKKNLKVMQSIYSTKRTRP